MSPGDADLQLALANVVVVFANLFMDRDSPISCNHELDKPG